MNKQSIPWVEKYRPTNFDDIVLDPINRRIFENILEKNYFPNLLFYGPPGTGKTTTIINIINEYQTRYNQKNKGTIIHLNASDERGIDIIRSQIHQFVKSKNLFEVGLKFVILDEVDYMTKNAQQALKYLLQSSCYNVRFCLICNYISKIDDSLKNEFICIRFNQLPKNDIFKFIRNITKNENLELSDGVIDRIQQIYNSDIRSMINFIQLNQNIQTWEENIITDATWEKLHNDVYEGFTEPLGSDNLNHRRFEMGHDVSQTTLEAELPLSLVVEELRSSDQISSFVDFTELRSVTSMNDLGFSMPLRGSEKPSNFEVDLSEDVTGVVPLQIFKGIKKTWLKSINELSNKYNVDKKNILKNYFNYIIRKKPQIITSDFLKVGEMIMHSNDTNITHILEYFVLHMRVILCR